MTEKNSVKAKVSTSSVAVEATGDSAASASKALADILSPFTNALGWVGDQFSFARRKAAIRAASEAIEQLKSEGITTAEIPPKILLPWLEGASLETDENNSLSSAWAGLFVRAVKSNDAAVISYMETLRKLGTAEAKLLEFFALDTSPSYTSKFYDQDELGIFLDSNPLRKDLIGDLEKMVSKGCTIGDLKNKMEDIGLQGMCQLMFFSIEQHRMIPTKFFEDNEHAISNLEHLGLVRIKNVDIETKFGILGLTWFQISKYAFDMIWACKGTLTGSKKGDKRRKQTKSKKASKD